MTDLVLNDDYTLQILNGDYAVGESEAQNVKLLLDTSQGEWTQNILVGVGLVRWLNGNLDGRLEREIQLQLDADGLNDLACEIQNENIYIYKK